jgi:hypothetical protein
MRSLEWGCSLSSWLSRRPWPAVSPCEEAKSRCRKRHTHAIWMCVYLPGPDARATITIIWLRRRRSSTRSHWPSSSAAWPTHSMRLRVGLPRFPNRALNRAGDGQHRPGALNRVLALVDRADGHGHASAADGAMDNACSFFLKGATADDETPARASVPFSEPADQLGCVAPDPGAAISEWVAKGVGPFLTLPGVTLECSYRAASPNRRSGRIRPAGRPPIELIQPPNDEPSNYRDFLAAGGNGPHHHGWFCQDYAAATGPDARIEGQNG